MGKNKIIFFLSLISDDTGQGKTNHLATVVEEDEQSTMSQEIMARQKSQPRAAQLQKEQTARTRQQQQRRRHQGYHHDLENYTFLDAVKDDTDDILISALESKRNNE